MNQYGVFDFGEHIILRQKFFTPNFFFTANLFTPKTFYAKINFTPKTFFTPKFLSPNFFTPKFVYYKIFLRLYFFTAKNYAKIFDIFFSRQPIVCQKAFLGQKAFLTPKSCLTPIKIFVLKNNKILVTNALANDNITFHELSTGYNYMLPLSHPSLYK